MKPQSLATQRSDEASKLEHLTLAISVLALMVGLVMAMVELRFGLLGAAIILGWTQLVGL